MYVYKGQHSAGYIRHVN